MLYNEFNKYISNDKIIFYNDNAINIKTIERITYAKPPNNNYMIYIDIDGGGYIDVDIDILYNIHEIIDGGKSVAIKFKFIFDINDDIELINLYYNENINDISSYIQKSISTYDLLNNNNTVSLYNSSPQSKIRFWKGDKSQYDTSTINENYIYFVSGKGIYVGSNQISSLDNVTWTTYESNSQKVSLTVNGVSKDLSLDGHTHNYVPTSRTINNKALSSNISLSASDVGALGKNEVAVDSNKLGNIEASKYYHDTNSNVNSVDWNAKNLKLNGAITGATSGSFSNDITAKGDIISEKAIKGKNVIIDNSVNLSYNNDKKCLQILFT